MASSLSLRQRVESKRIDQQKLEDARAEDVKKKLEEVSSKLLPTWNKYAKQYCNKSDVEPLTEGTHCRREFCNGLSSNELLENLKSDENMEFKTPADYAALQRKRDPNGVASPNLQWPHEHIPPRLAAQPDDVFDRGAKDCSVGWASLASWYYPRHEGIINKAWQAYEQYKLDHSGRPILVDDQRRVHPFVRTKTYKHLQARSDELALDLAPQRYASIREGLDVVALFLGNGTELGIDALVEFGRAIYNQPNPPNTLNLAECHKRNPPQYSAPARNRTVSPKYMPLKEFILQVFMGFPASGGPNWDNGINPLTPDTVYQKREGKWRPRKADLTKAEKALEDEFTAILYSRRGKLDFTLRVMGGLCIPTSVKDLETIGRDYPGAKALIDKLWIFLVVHAWPVYRRWRASQEAPFASIEAHHKRWFREVHYDEYDRWAYMKWAQTGKSPFTRINRKEQLPDLYTLMKRRHKIVMERDECYEEDHAYLRAKKDLDAYLEERKAYALVYESDVVMDRPVANVRRPVSGGRSYGAGAYHALAYDPYCTFGRQRKRPLESGNFVFELWRTPAEQLYSEWALVQDIINRAECNHCGDDDTARRYRFPGPYRPPGGGGDDDDDGDDKGDSKKGKSFMRKRKKGIKPATSKRTANKKTDDDDDGDFYTMGFFDAPITSSAARATPGTRLRRRLTAILLGRHRRAAEPLAI